MIRRAPTRDFGLDAGQGGRFHLFWSDNGTGVYHSWTAVVTVRQ